MREKKINYIEFLNSKRILKVALNVQKTFKKYQQEVGCLESGGVLLGYVYNYYDVIVKATEPNKLDSRGPYSFNRNKIPAQKQIDKSWNKSYGCLIYLGEWHTHSEIKPSPSSTDKNMIKGALEKTTMEIEYLYFIIVGLNENFWVGQQSNEGLISLHKKRSTVL